MNFDDSESLDNIGSAGNSKSGKILRSTHRKRPTCVSGYKQFVNKKVKKN